MRNIVAMLALACTFSYSPAMIAQEDDPKKEEAQQSAEDQRRQQAMENGGKLFTAWQEQQSIIPAGLHVTLAYWAILADYKAFWTPEEIRELDELGTLYVFYGIHHERVEALLNGEGRWWEKDGRLIEEYLIRDMTDPAYLGKIQRYMAAAKQIATIVALKARPLIERLPQNSPRVEEWNKEAQKRFQESAPFLEKDPANKEEPKSEPEKK